MTYAKRICHDADSHIMETRDWLEPYLDSAIRDRIKPGNRAIMQVLDGMVETARKRKTDKDAEAKAAENPIAGPKAWLAYGAFDTEERGKALDGFGFSSQLVFPTFSLLPAMMATEDDVLYGAARAANRAMGAFAKPDKRLIGVGYVPLDNPARAVEEVDVAIESGCRAIQVSAGAAGDHSPGHADLDPFWAKLCAHKVPFMLHIGPGTMTQSKKFQNNGRERAPDFHGGGENLRFPDYMSLGIAPQIFLTAIAYDGVFERFPTLRGGVIESGAAWLPSFLRLLDYGYQSFSRTDPYLKGMSMTPSQFIRRAVKFTPFPNEDLSWLIKEVGADLLLFSTDYPHPEGTNDPLGRFEKTMTEVDEPAKEKFYRTNFEAMMAM